jgi:hypothetical protein
MLWYTGRRQKRIQYIIQSKEFKVINEYVHNTKEGWKIDIESIYKIKRDPD